MPFVLVDRIGNGQRHSAMLLVRVSDMSLVKDWNRRCWLVSIFSFFMRLILTAVKSVLVVTPRVISDLDATPSLVGILKQIHIGALVKAMMMRLNLWRCI